MSYKTSVLVSSFLVILAVVAIASANSGDIENAKIKINVTTDKSVVAPGDTFTISGTIAMDNVTNATFQYRIAAVAPPRVIVCDSGNLTTSGSFSFSCTVPTLAQMNASNVSAINSRAVVPIRAGIAVKEVTTNSTAKRHGGKAILVTTDKYRTKMDDFVNKSAEAANRTAELASRCSEVSARVSVVNATGPNCTRIIAMRDLFAEKAQKARELRDNPMGDMDAFKMNLEDMREKIKVLVEEIKNIQEGARMKVVVNRTRGR